MFQHLLGDILSAQPRNLCFGDRSQLSQFLCKTYGELYFYNELFTTWTSAVTLNTVVEQHLICGKTDKGISVKTKCIIFCNKRSVFLRPIIIPTSIDFVLYITHEHRNISGTYTTKGSFCIKLQFLEIPRGFSKDFKQMMLNFL